MTVIRPNSISGITSITAQGDTVNFFKSDGNSAGLQLNGVNFNTTTGVSTFLSLVVTGNVSIAGTLTYEDVTNVDSIGIVTARSGVRIDAGGIVVVGVTTVAAGTVAAPSISPTGDSDTGIFFPSADTIAFGEGGAEVARFDSSGRLLVGTATALSVGEPANALFQVLGRVGGATDVGRLAIARGEAATSITSGEEIGKIYFTDNAGNTFGQIECTADADAGASDFPGRLVFSTTPDASATPTERMRITAAGRVGIGVSAPATNLQVNAASDVSIALSNSSSVTSGPRGGIYQLNSAFSTVGLINFAAVTDNVGTEIQFYTRPAAGLLTQTMTLDSTGRLLLGTSTARTIFENGAASARVQVEGTDNSTSRLTVIRNGGGGGITLAGTAGASVGSIDAVANNATLGEIAFAGSDGTDFVNAANISAYVDGTPGDNDMPGRLVFSTTADGASSPTERMRIDSSGNVGIGAASPGAKLEIADTRNSTLLRLTATSGENWDFKNTNTVGSTDVLTIGALGVTANLALDDVGRVGIGTVTPRRTLEVSGADGLFCLNATDTSTGTSQLLFGDTDDDNIGRIYYDHANNAMAFYTNTSERMRIDNAGILYSTPTYNDTTANAANVFIGATGRFSRSTSSIKYKTDVETIQDFYADAVLNCRPVWYRSTTGNDNPDWGWWGFIAEEVAEIDPRLVQWKTIESAYDENGSLVQTPCEPEPEGVSYDRFVPHLLNLIKRQMERIEQLETEMAAVKAQLS
jgi:hypothetical protein